MKSLWNPSIENENPQLWSPGLGSAPDPTKSTDWSVSVGSVTSPTDPTLGFRIEIGRLVGWSVGGRTFGRSVVGFAYAFFKIQLSRMFLKKIWRLL